MGSYLLVLAATVLLAFEFAFSKKYQTMEGAGMAAGLRYNLLTGIFTAVIFFCIAGFKPEFSVFSLVLVALTALCGAAYNVISFRILKAGGLALYSLFLMLGGMLLPYVYGVLFLDEKLSMLRVIGLVLIVAAVFCSGRTRVKVPGWVYICCVAVFVLNGCVSILSKLHQIETVQPTISTAAFVMYSGMGRALFCGTALLAVGKKAEKPVSSPWKLLGVAAAAAAVSGLSYLLQLTGAAALPATVLYPMVTGGSIIFSALSGLVFFREKLSKWQIISIALCFAGTLLFL